MPAVNCGMWVSISAHETPPVPPPLACTLLCCLCLRVVLIPFFLHVQEDLPGGPKSHECNLVSHKIGELGSLRKAEQGAASKGADFAFTSDCFCHVRFELPCSPRRQAMMIAIFSTTHEPRGSSAEALRKPGESAHGPSKARAHDGCVNVLASEVQGMRIDMY